MGNSCVCRTTGNQRAALIPIFEYELEQCRVESQDPHKAMVSAMAMMQDPDKFIDTKLAMQRKGQDRFIERVFEVFDENKVSRSPPRLSSA